MNKYFIFSTLVFLTTILSGCNNEQAGNAGSASQPQKVYNWKMVTTWPPNFPVFQEGVDRFAKQLKVISGGRLNIKVFAGGELVPALQSFDAVSQGTVEMGHGAAYYWAGKVPAAQFLSTVPFGMTAKGMQAWLYSGGGLELWQTLYKPFGLVAFPMGNSGVQMGGWFNKEINSIEDLKGLKMRIPGLGGKVFAKAGGSPVLMAGGELYTALERGTIDATEWVGPYHDQRLGLYRAAKHYYYPGWHEPGTTLELIVNEKAWNELPQDLQTMIRVTAMANDLWIYSQFESLNIKALHELKEKHGITPKPFPKDVLASLKALTEEALAEESAKDPEFKRIYEAYEQFRQGNIEWDRISEHAYRQAVE